MEDQVMSLREKGI